MGQIALNIAGPINLRQPPQATLKKVSATAPISPDEEKLLRAAWEKLPKQ